MNNFNKLHNVAEVAAQIMSEGLKGDQHKIDKNKNNKIDSEDLKMLRKEEQEQLDELSPGTLKSYIKGAKSDKAAYNDEKFSAREAGDHKVASDAAARVVKRKEGIKAAKANLNREETECKCEEKHEGACKMEEDVEQILEYETDKSGRYVHKGTYGTAKGAEYGDTDYDKENDLAKSLDKKKPKKKAYGARQNFVRSTRVNETFTGLMSVYNEAGLKALAEAWGKKKKVMTEEPTNEKFKKELDAQQKKSETKVEEETVDIELVIDGQNGYDQVQIEERSLTDAETAKKEEIVKSMKKGLSGFKERYGKDAKSVMYATATKQAKGD